MVVDLIVNYIVKVVDRVLKVMGKGVWYGRMYFVRDMWVMLFGDMDEGMVFSGFGIKDIKKVK